jgi:hypothetical protein
VKTLPARILPYLLLSLTWASAASAQEPPATNPPAQEPEQAPAPPQRNVRQPPPPLPRVPDVRQPGESGFYIGINAWFPRQNPIMNKGRGALFTTESYTQLQGKPSVGPGAEIGFAAGAHNSVRLIYFEDRATGAFINATDLQLWNQFYTAGNYVQTDYRVQHAKLVFDYLTWPFPVEKRRFRLRTLWGVQYTNIRTGFDLPLQPTVDANGNPLTDASGNPLNYATSGSHWFISPDIGIGVTQYIKPHIRVEANASGFTIPRHTTNWDADGSINLRTGHWEFRAGIRAFHFKTSTGAEFYMRGTQASPFVGLRWYSR